LDERSARPLSLHVAVHAWPAGDVERERMSLFGRDVRVCRVSPQRLVQPMALRFEDVIARLAVLPRLFIEPDGSFVWVNPHSGAPAWQIDGQLHDAAGGLMTIELKLMGNQPDWSSVARCVGWPRQQLLFQLLQHGTFLDDAAWQAVYTGVLGPV
jgi:hypothetical protein